MRLEMKSMVKALDGQWEGTAYEEFISTYDKMDDKLYLICTSVQNYVTAIQAAAENEKETENSSVGSIRNKQRNYSFAPPAKGRG